MSDSRQLTQVVRIYEQGDPAVLRQELEETGRPGLNEVIIRQHAIAFNFVDTFFRSGFYRVNQFPFTIGVEAAGIIEATGPGVTNFTIGDRVAYTFVIGAYREKRVMGTDKLVKIPDDVTYEVAAALQSKGLTARMLLKEIYPAKEGDTILLHAAAGGVGILTARWARSMGVKVIGTVGSKAKKEMALNNGADHVIALDSENLVKRVKQITAFKGVDAVLDSVGNGTFLPSLDVLKNGGTAVLYGGAAGYPEVDQDDLFRRGIQFVMPNIGSFVPDRHTLEEAIEDVYTAYLDGTFGKLAISTFYLREAEDVHRLVLERKLTGFAVFKP